MSAKCFTLLIHLHINVTICLLDRIYLKVKKILGGSTTPHPYSCVLEISFILENQRMPNICTMPIS